MVWVPVKRGVVNSHDPPGPSAKPIHLLGPQSRSAPVRGDRVHHCWLACSGRRVPGAEIVQARRLTHSVVPLDQLTEFWQVWDCLRDCGWTQVRVGGDPRFVRPGCASGYGQEGFEWFGDDEAVQDPGRDHCIDGRERTGALEWWELWDALRDQGWKRHRSGKLLAPGGSIDGREGVQWFAAPDDVVAFRKRPPTKTKDIGEAWRALEALGWKEDARGPHGRCGRCGGRSPRNGSERRS